MSDTPQRRNWSHSPRLVGRCVALVVALMLVLGPLPPSATRLMPAISPYVAICSAVAVRSFGILALCGLPVLALTLMRRRWFCRHACPVGLIAEYAGRCSTRASHVAFPPLGKWIVLLTLFGACLGYPLLLWTDPLALFSCFFSGWRSPLKVAELLSGGIGLAIVILLSLLWPNLWCRRVCPLGATQELFAMLGRAVSRRSAGSPWTSTLGGRRLARRSVLAMGLGTLWATVLLHKGRGNQFSAIRPPGSIVPQQFSGVCVRCGNCIAACPTKIITPDLGTNGIASFLTPSVSFEQGYCKEDCCRCTEVCPSGAITRLSLEQKRNTSMGLAKVDMSICILSTDKECSVCVNACPYEAIQIKFDWDTYLPSLTVDLERCNGCGACELTCVTSPKKAITVVPSRAIKASPDSRDTNAQGTA